MIMYLKVRNYLQILNYNGPVPKPPENSIRNYFSAYKDCQNLLEDQTTGQIIV